MPRDARPKTVLRQVRLARVEKEIGGRNNKVRVPLHTTNAAVAVPRDEVARRAVILEWALARGADPGAPSADDVGMQPLHWACTEGRLACARLLVDRGAGVAVVRAARARFYAFARVSREGDTSLCRVRSSRGCR